MANTFYQFEKIVNIGTLTEELRAAFPSAGIDIGATQSGATCLVNAPDTLLEGEIQTVVNAHDAEVLQILAASHLSIQSLKSIATANAPFIVALNSIILNADYNGDTMATVWTAVVSELGSQGTGIQTRFKQAVLRETGYDIDTITVPLLTDVHKRAILSFVRRFAASWAIVLTS